MSTVTPATARTCPNCGHVVNLEFCPQCGQEYVVLNSSLRSLLFEFLDEVFKFDSKLFRTLALLATKPGQLTREWAAGRRMRYIAPLKLYLTVSAAFFLILSLTASKTDPHFHATVNMPSFKSGPHLTLLERVANRLVTFASSNQIFVRDQLVNRLPLSTLATVPLLAAVLHILYLRRRKFYVEHVVFLFHAYSFTFLTMSIMRLTRNGWLQLAGLAIVGVYFFLAMKRNYDQDWARTIVKTALFQAAYFVIYVIALTITFVVAAMTTT